jgi:hypothetical protein
MFEFEKKSPTVYLLSRYNEKGIWWYVYVHCVRRRPTLNTGKYNTYIMSSLLDTKLINYDLIEEIN